MAKTVREALMESIDDNIEAIQADIESGIDLTRMLNQLEVGARFDDVQAWVDLKNDYKKMSKKGQVKDWLRKVNDFVHAVVLDPDGKLNLALYQKLNCPLLSGKALALDAAKAKNSQEEFVERFKTGLIVNLIGEMQSQLVEDRAYCINLGKHVGYEDSHDPDGAKAAYEATEVPLNKDPNLAEDLALIKGRLTLGLDARGLTEMTHSSIKEIRGASPVEQTRQVNLLDYAVWMSESNIHNIKKDKRKVPLQKLDQIVKIYNGVFSAADKITYLNQIINAAKYYIEQKALEKGSSERVPKVKQLLNQAKSQYKQAKLQVKLDRLIDIASPMFRDKKASSEEMASLFRRIYRVKLNEPLSHQQHEQLSALEEALKKRVEIVSVSAASAVPETPARQTDFFLPKCDKSGDAKSPSVSGDGAEEPGKENEEPPPSPRSPKSG
jgi:hypothetical protein